MSQQKDPSPGDLMNMLQQPPITPLDHGNG
jgi:hypothetical protein